MYTVLFVLSFSFHRLQYVHMLRTLVLTLACALYNVCAGGPEHKVICIEGCMRVREVLHTVIDVRGEEGAAQWASLWYPFLEALFC